MEAVAVCTVSAPEKSKSFSGLFPVSCQAPRAYNALTDGHSPGHKGEMMMKENYKSFIRGALAGSLAGSLAALLFAPKSGRELRQDITDQARHVSDKGQEIVGKISETSIEYTDKIKEVASAVIHEIGQWRKKDEIIPEASVLSVPVEDDTEEDGL